MSDHTDHDMDALGISRRSFLGQSALGALGLSLGCAPAAGPGVRVGETRSTPTPPARRPNLVFITADQLNRRHTGYGGDEKAYTPNIDRLAREGTDFRNAVAGFPMCAPFRASLLTGKYPSSTGMVINELRCMPDPDAFGHVLSRNGYRTAHIGKWHLFGKNHSDPQQFVPPGPYRLGFDDYWAGYNFHHSNYKGFYYRDTFDKVEVEGFEPDVQTTMAIDYMREAKGREEPFAVFMSVSVPHDPWNWDNSPETFNQLFRNVDFPDPPNFRPEGHALYWSRNRDHDWYQRQFMPNRFRYRQVYHAMTAALDWNMGRIQKALDDLGLADDTILVLTSDHGEMFGAHGRVAKKIFYEEAVNIPFLVRWPGAIPAGHVAEAPLDAPDMMPTLLGLMGLPIPGSVEGMDLSRAARGEQGEEPAAALMQGMGHTFQWSDGDEWRSLRSPRYTYAVMRADRSEYLFDNQEDPYQMRNLVGDPGHRGTLDEFRDMLRERMAALNDTFESTTWYRDHWTEDRVIVRSATRELEPEFRPENIPLPHLAGV